MSLTCALEVTSPTSVAANPCASLTSHFSNEHSVTNSGATNAAFSLAAVNPIVAPRRPALENNVAPTSSKLRVISAADNPLPDLNDKYRLAIAAPPSDGPSLEEPALG